MASETPAKLVTYDDYRHLPDDGKQYQIIGGELHMTPAPSTIHQRISRNLFRMIDNCVTEKNLGEVLFAPVVVILSMTDIVQPDLIFVDKSRQNIITKKNIVEAPDLIVEIISEYTETLDRVKKKELYEQNRVKEYWLVDPENRQIDLYVLEEQALILKSSTGMGQPITSALLHGCDFPVDKVFE